MTVHTYSGARIFISDSAHNDRVDLVTAQGLSYTEIKFVGSIGEYGNDTNILSYPLLGEVVSQKQKGETNAGDPVVECGRNSSDPGQIAMRIAGSPGYTDSHVFKLIKQDDSEDYLRGLVIGPVSPGGRNEDFDLHVFVIAVKQKVEHLPGFPDPFLPEDGGVLYSLSPPDIYQDAAGTTPADAPSDPVGRGDDLHAAEQFTTTYESDFSGGVDGWQNQSNTVVDGNIDGVEGLDDWLRVTAGGSGGSTVFRRSESFAPGKDYRVVMRVYVPSDNSFIDGFKVYSAFSGIGLLLYDGQGENGSIINIDITEYIKTIGTNPQTLYLYGFEGASQSVDVGAAGDVIYIREVTIQQSNIWPLIQPVSDSRPTWDGAETQFDGIDDFLFINSQSVGDTSLFCDAGQQFTVWAVFNSSVSGSGSIVSRRGSVPFLEATFVLFVGSSTTIRVNLRGLNNNSGVSSKPGNYQIAIVTWEGDSANIMVDSLSETPLSVGGVAENTSGNIVVGSQTESGIDTFTGEIPESGIIDRALSINDRRRLMQYFSLKYGVTLS